MILHFSDAPEVNFDHLPELAGYTNQPEAMYVGCPGKHGYLKLVFEVDDSGKHVMRERIRRAPLIVKSEMYFDEEMPEIPCVYIQSSGGPNVDGDRYEQDFYLKKGAMAYVSTGAATKIAEMKRNYSGMKQTITLDENAWLEYLPEPIIPHKHSRYVSDTRIVVHPSAGLCYSEIYACGRKYYGGGEIFEYDVLSICARGERPDGTPLFREKFVISPREENVRDIGAMDFYDMFANVIFLAPKEKSEELYARTEPFIDREARLACGITRLPNDAGLLFKILGMELGPVKKLARKFCSDAREVVKGRPLPPEFPWR